MIDRKNVDCCTVKMSVIVSLLLVLLLASPVLAFYKKPNIIMIVADDLGWDDVSFHGSNQIPTPTIDRLAREGVTLNNYYVSPLSTPTRTAFMTGKYASRLGVQHDSFHNQQPVGLPLGETLLPNHLRELGYSAHGVGKWHLGFFAKEYTPTYRGFDSFYGFWTDTEDYFSHVSYDKGYGLDLRRNLELVYNESGTYSTELFTRQAKAIIDKHNDNEKPLFLYVAHQAVHVGNGDDPLQAPEKYIKKFSSIPDNSRRKFAGMVSTLDDSLKSITEALTAKNMLDNTIIIFTTDNGGAAGGYDNSAGSNYPLRGTKHTLWEGGVRATGFVYSPLIQNKGRVCDELIHATDWLPTVYAAGGGNVVSLGKIDGYDVWKTLSEGVASPRFEVLHGIDNAGPLSGALRVGDYKLIVNQDDSNYGDWYPRPGTSIPLGTNERKRRSVEEGTTVDCTIQEHHPLLFTHAPVCKPREKPCLFNIKWDPCEYHNIAEIMPNTMKVMLERFYHFANSSVQPIYPEADNSSNPNYHDGAWTFWRDSPIIPSTANDYTYPDPMIDLKYSDGGGGSAPVVVPNDENIFKEKAKIVQQVKKNATTHHTVKHEHHTSHHIPPLQHNHTLTTPEYPHHDSTQHQSVHHHESTTPQHHTANHHGVTKPHVIHHIAHVTHHNKTHHEQAPPMVQHVHPSVVIDGISNVLNEDNDPAPVINGISNILNNDNLIPTTQAPETLLPEPNIPNPTVVPTEMFKIPTAPPAIDIQNLLMDQDGSGTAPTDPPITDYILPTVSMVPPDVMKAPTLGEVISGKPMGNNTDAKPFGTKSHKMKVDMPQVYDVIDETENGASDVDSVVDMATTQATKATSKPESDNGGSGEVPTPKPMSPLSSFFKPKHVVAEAPHRPASHSFEGDIVMDGHKFHVKGTETGDFNFMNEKQLDSAREQKSHVTQKPDDSVENYSEITDVIDDTLEEMDKPIEELPSAKKMKHAKESSKKTKVKTKEAKSHRDRKPEAKLENRKHLHHHKNTNVHHKKKKIIQHQHTKETTHNITSVTIVNKNDTASKKNDTDCEKPPQLQTSDNAVVVSSVVIVVIASAMVVGVALVAMIAVVARHIKKSREEENGGSS